MGDRSVRLFAALAMLLLLADCARRVSTCPKERPASPQEEERTVLPASGTSASAIRCGPALLDAALSPLALGEPVCAGNLAVIPILEPPRTGSETDYMDLDDALRNKLVVVREVGNQGSVPLLEIESRASWPVFIPFGAILTGGRQDRMVREETVLSPGEKREIPVFCVEQGRWRKGVDGARFGRYWNSACFGLKSNAALGDSQGTVWRNVRHWNSAIGIGGSASFQGNFDSEVFREKAKRLGKVRTDLSKRKNVVGILAVVDGGFGGMEVFVSPAYFRRMWERLFQGLVVDAAASKPEKAVDAKAARQAAVEGFRLLAGCEASETNRDGMIRFDLRQEDAAGSAILDGARKTLVYFKFFPKASLPGGAPGTGSGPPFQGIYWNSAIGIGNGTGRFLGGRFGGRRNLRRASGDRETESAVLRGLVWLKNHQDPDGSWSCKEFMANCKEGACTGAGADAGYDTGVTGLALLAFLGAGQTHKHGRYKNTVKKGLQALKACQSPEGRFGPECADGRWIYNHALCTMAAAEVYGMSNWSPLLQGMAQKSVDFLADCRNPGLGWRYGRRPGDNDSSVTGWAAMALKSADLCGLDVPAECFEGALAWFDRVTDETYHRVGYTDKRDTGMVIHEVASGPVPPMETPTAAAVFCRMLIRGAGQAERPEVAGGGDLLQRIAPSWNPETYSIDMIFWHFGTLAMFQLGGERWSGWNESLKNALVPHQKRDGCENGSWDPIGAWGAAGGRVYATAINVLTLETYYRFVRVARDR